MQLSNRFRTDPGLLCSIIYTAALLIASFALQPQLGLSQPLVEKSAPSSGEDRRTTTGRSQPGQPAAKPVVVTGIIVRKSSGYILRDANGSEYRLDAPKKAEPYEGKPSKVTGTLDVGTNLLHVETIEAIAA